MPTLSTEERLPTMLSWSYMEPWLSSAALSVGMERLSITVPHAPVQSRHLTQTNERSPWFFLHVCVCFILFCQDWVLRSPGWHRTAYVAKHALDPPVSTSSVLGLHVPSCCV